MSETKKKKDVIKRLILMFVGVALIGMGSGMFRIADMGLDPFSCAVSGINIVTGIEFGNVQLLLNVFLLIFVIFLCRKSIGIGTLVNMAGVGYMSDFTVWIVQEKLGFEPVFLLKLIIMLAFLVIFGFGIALYMEAKMGTAPYDTLGDIIDERTHGKIPYRYARIILDVICVLVGVAFGLTRGKMVFGICTIVLACGTGLIAGFFRKLLTAGNKEKNGEN